jgi:mono/diheme cytochrome c family protein
MRDVTRTLAMMVLSGVSTAAWALPWNIDMVDSDAVKAYEQEMRTLPQGVVAQPNALTPFGYVRNYVRESAEGQALSNPFEVNDAFLATGERMYGVYCQPCHGDGLELGPVGAAGRYPGVAVLRGEQGRLPQRTDGHVYLTVRNGGGIMPSYGWAMNDREMWSIVAWMRSAWKDAQAPSAGAASTVPMGADGGAPAPAAPGTAPQGQEAP